MKQTSVVQLLIYVQNEISKQIDTPNENFMFFRQNISAPNEIGYDSMSWNKNSDWNIVAVWFWCEIVNACILWIPLKVSVVWCTCAPLFMLNVYAYNPSCTRSMCEYSLFFYLSLSLTHSQIRSLAHSYQQIQIKFIHRSIYLNKKILGKAFNRVRMRQSNILHLFMRKIYLEQYAHIVYHIFTSDWQWIHRQTTTTIW